MTRAQWLDLRTRYRNACLADRGENNERAARLQSEPLRRTCAPFWPTRRWQAAVVDSLPPVLRVQLQQKPATTDELDPRSRNLRAVVRFHADRRNKANLLRNVLRRLAPTPTVPGTPTGAPLAVAGHGSLPPRAPVTAGLPGARLSSHSEAA